MATGKKRSFPEDVWLAITNRVLKQSEEKPSSLLAVIVGYTLLYGTFLAAVLALGYFWQTAQGKKILEFLSQF